MKRDAPSSIVGDNDEGNKSSEVSSCEQVQSNAPSAMLTILVKGVYVQEILIVLMMG